MSKFILLGGALALAAGTTVAFKFTHRPAQAASAGPIDPALLHSFLQRGREEMALP
jgi:hypothetical protein